MAFKDKFEKLVSYFDTDEVSDVEETELDQSPVKPQPASQQAPLQPKRPNNPVSQPVRPSQQPAQRQQAPIHAVKPTDEPASVRPTNQANLRRDNYQPAARTEQTTIALKYPRKYEDAQEIVDLLIVNECVLIDFQYMLDAQARRCLDFIDGASKVLYGKLQKVGTSMFLLTPSNVTVDIEELNHQHSRQDLGFDFDMKRR